MTLTTLLAITLIISSAAANIFSSGMFLIRISSEQTHHIQYCFTELPYSVKRRQSSRCLKSGDVEVAKKAEKVIDLSLINVTTAYITVEFIIQSGEQGPTRYVSERVVVDGALPAKRVAVSSGMVMDFVTICDRPWYGLMCSRYCIEYNDVHYVCDTRGEKVCLAGWTGKDCEIASKDVFLVHSDDSTQAPPTATPTTTATSTFTGRLRTGTLGINTVETTATAPVTSFVVTSTRRESRVQKGSKTPSFITSTSIYTVQNTRTTLLLPTRTIIPTSTNNQASTPHYKNRHTSASSSVKHDSESHTYGITLVLFLLLVAIIGTGYTFTLCARKTSMQNWINSRRAKIFARVTCAAAVQIQRCDAEVPVQKVTIFAIDMEKAMTNVAYETTEDLGPRYSSQPTTSADQSPSKSVVSTIESNIYHEIDSFLVPPSLVEEGIATLV